MMDYPIYPIIISVFIITCRCQTPTQSPSEVSVADITSDGILLKWQHVVNSSWVDLPENRHYMVKFRMNNSSVFNITRVNSTENQYNISGLKPFTVYELIVGAVNSHGDGKFSQPIYNKTLPSIPIAYPSDIIAYNTSSYSVNITWSDIIEEDWAGNYSLGFNIKIDQSNNLIFVSYPNTSYVASGLEPYKSYIVEISCVNEVGEGPYSPQVTVMTDEEAPVISPSNIIISYVNTSSFSIAWDEVTLDNIHGIFRGVAIYIEAVYSAEDLVITKDTIRVIRSAPEIYTNGLILGRQRLIESNISITTKNITGLLGYTRYNVTMAILTKFDGVLSAPQIIRTEEMTPIISAFNLSCYAVSPTSIVVTWKHSPPAFLQGTRIMYKVYYTDQQTTVETLIDQYRNNLQAIFLKTDQLYSFWISAFTIVGEGNLTDAVSCPTLEDVPQTAPINFTSSSFESSDSTNLRWTHIPSDDWKGRQLGYTVYYRKVTMGELELEQEEPWVNIEIPLVTTYLINGLDTYSKYEIQIAGRTNAGPGLLTDKVYFETCHIKSPDINVFYANYPPYVIASSDLKERPSGMLIEQFERIIHNASHRCKAFHRNISIVYNFANDPDIEYESNRTEDKIIIPHFDHLGFSPFYSDIEMVHNVGFTLVKVPQSQEELLLKNESFLLDGIISALPLVLFYLLINALFGAIFWFTEPTKVGHQSCGISMYGMFEGCYLAVMTSTTVGYGDKIPVTTIGRVYIVFWTLIGLALTGMVTGNMTSILSSASINSLSSKFPEDKVIAAHDTSEYYYADRNIPSFDRNSTYHSYIEVFKELYDGKVRNALVDTNVATLNRYDLLKKGLRLSQLSDFHAKVGFALFGQYRKLEEASNSYVTSAKDVIEKRLLSLREEAAERVLTLDITEEETLSLVTFKSPLFQKTLGYLMAAFGGLLLFGVLYEVYKWYNDKKEERRVKSIQEIKSLEQKKLQDVTGDLTFQFAALRRNINTKSGDLLNKHANELITLQDEISNLYDINFKYIKSYELGLPLEELVRYRAEIEGRTDPTLLENTSKHKKVMKERVGFWVNRIKDPIMNGARSVYGCLRHVVKEI